MSCIGRCVEKLHDIYNIYELSSSIKLSRFFRILATSSFVILLAWSYVFLNPTNNIITTFVGNITGTNNGVYADDTPATSGLPVDDIVVLNMDLAHPNASLDVTPHNTTGTFSSSSADDSVAFSVSTNNYKGYTLSISSSTNNDTGLLTNTDTNIITNNTFNFS